MLRDLKETYGLITRANDPATGHTVLTVAGLVLGTASAAECLLDEDCHAMEAVQRGMASVGFDAPYFNIDPHEGETNEAALRRFHELVAQATGLAGA